MSLMREPPTPDRSYEAIEAAVTETARGRWFLAEHARRNRAADTVALLGAVARLEATVSARRAADRFERLRHELGQMTTAVARTRAEVVGRAFDGDGAGRLRLVSDGPDSFVPATRKASADILDATEKLQEVAFHMRGAGFDPVLCDTLERRAAEIYAASEAQNRTVGRIEDILRLLAPLEARLEARGGVQDGGAGPFRSGEGRVGEAGCRTAMDVDSAVGGGPAAPSGNGSPVRREGGRIGNQPLPLPVIAADRACGPPSTVATILARLRALERRDRSPVPS